MIKINKLNKVLLIAIIIVALISVLDILSLKSGVFGTPEQYVNGAYTDGWWELFKNIALIFIVIASVVYYIVKKDLSETIAIAVSSYVIWIFGLADVLFFFFQGKMIPSVLPWLQNNDIIGWFTHYQGVTSMSLVLSALVGIASAYLISKFLVEKL